MIDFTEEEKHQITLLWFDMRDGKIDTAGMTEEEIEALKDRINELYEQVHEHDMMQIKANKARMKREIRCPRCGSNQFAAGNKGFGLGKALAGGLALGPVGLLGGFVGSGQVTLSCLKCGKKWLAGQ